MKKLMLLLLVMGTVATTRAQDFNNRNNNPYDSRPQRPRLLSRTEFTYLQDAVKKAPFADDKRNTFRVVMQDKLMTVDQLQGLLKQITFNDDKLDWAMMAYAYTADTQQFYRLRNSFSFMSTQEKFDQFLLHKANDDRPGRHRARLISRDEFAEVQQMIRKEPFADGKKKVFQIALKSRLITVAQLSDLLRQFTFDDDKLSFAILAYDYTADVQRYYLVRDLFTFDSSKQKLDKFLLEAGS